MFNRPTDIWPQIMIDELLKMARRDRDWVEWVPKDNETYTARSKYHTVLNKLQFSGQDAFAMWASSIFLLDGPKVFRPTVEQCEAMTEIEVNLTLTDYAQPYPAILIDLPSGFEAGPFSSVLLHKSDRMLSCLLHDLKNDHRDDIVTTIAVDGRPIEVSLNRFDPSCLSLGPKASRALRVAINSALALVNFGCRLDWLLPHDVARDRRLAEENSERGERARKRLPLSVHRINFTQEVTLHRTETHKEAGEPAGGEKATHWRRGHWAMQAFGVGRLQRKRILRPPVLVRKDRLAPGDTITTIYKT